MAPWQFLLAVSRDERHGCSAGMWPNKTITKNWWDVIGLFRSFFWISWDNIEKYEDIWGWIGQIYGSSADRHTHTHTHTCCQVLWEHSSGAKSSMGCNGLSGLFDDASGGYKRSTSLLTTVWLPIGYSHCKTTRVRQPFWYRRDK